MTPSGKRSSCSASRCHSPPSCCSRPVTWTASSCTSRSARTCGCRSRPRATGRWRARPCLPICPPATSPSASPTTAGCSAPPSRGGRSAAYIYTAAGLGESTTDLAWDGQAAIFENGDLVCEAERFSDSEQLILADIDLDRIRADRASISSFGDSVGDHRRRLRRVRRIEFELGIAAQEVPLARKIERFPYVPSDPVGRRERCEEVYNIQVRGLMTRAARDRYRQGRDRCLGWPRLDPRTDRVRPRDGQAGAPALECARVHDARVRDQRGDPRQRARADEGAGSKRRGNRHPPIRHPDAARPGPPGRTRRVPV